MKPITYESWHKKVGEESWIECPVIVAEEVRRSELAIMKAADVMSKAIAQKLFEDGAKPGIPDVDIHRKIELNAWVFNASVRSENECLPEQYTYMAYQMWLREYDNRIEWEDKTLWQYIKHWLKRLKNGASN